MRVALVVLALVFFSSSVTYAQQNPDERVLYLVNRILEKLPDARYTSSALGRGEERESRASQHAVAIINAADEYVDRWEEIAVKSKWLAFKPERDLPALIAALAFRESSFRPVARTRDASLSYTVPDEPADMGVMQVHVPSPIARDCGVVTDEDKTRLLEDLDFSYLIGTCALTSLVDSYVMRYAFGDYQQLKRNQRPDIERRFYGVSGPRRGTIEARRARELMVVERYNWGPKTLYTHELSAGYARRVIKNFEYFRMPDKEETS